MKTTVRKRGWLAMGLTIIVLIVVAVIVTSVILHNLRTHRYSDSRGIHETAGSATNKQVKMYFGELQNESAELPEKVTGMLEQELKKIDWKKSLSTDELYSIFHKTIYAGKFPSNQGKGKSLFIIVFSNSTGNLYHAARGRISLFEFRKDHQEWKMIRKYPAFTYGDEWGMEPRSIKMVKTGSGNRFGILVRTGFASMGHEQEWESLYAEIRDSLTLVFEYTAYEYYFNPPPDEQYIDDYTEMRFIESGKKFFDIETKKGITEWSDISKADRELFVFTEKGYVKKVR